MSLASLDLEGDLRVDSVVGNPIVFDCGLHLLNIDRLDIAHRLGGLLDCTLCGILPALLGLGQYFDDLQCCHGSSSWVCCCQSTWQCSQSFGYNPQVAFKRPLSDL